jgi:hypothetical protein
MCRGAQKYPQTRLCTTLYEYHLGGIVFVIGVGGGHPSLPLLQPITQLIALLIKQRRLFIGLLIPPCKNRLVTRSGCQTVSDVDHFLVNSYKKQIRESNSSFGELIIVYTYYMISKIYAYQAVAVEYEFHTCRLTMPL